MATALLFIDMAYRLLTFFLHGRIADENGPHIGAGLGDHQDPYGDDGYQVHGIKNGFYDGLQSLYC